MFDLKKSIVETLLACVDEVGANLVAHTYHNLVNHYANMMWLFTAIYLGFQFFQAMQGRIPFYDVMNTVFKVLIFLTLALNYDYFCLFIYNIFTKEPLVIMQAMIIDGEQPSGATISQALDHYLNAGLADAKAIYLMGSWSNIIFYLFAGAVLVMTFVVTIIALGLIVLSKCAMVILLALSPLFIFSGLFAITRGLFESYVRHLFTYALIPVLCSAVLMILLSVMEVVMKFMHQFPKASYLSVAPFLLMSGVQIYLLAQVYSKASALGGGFALGGLVSTLRQAKANMGSVAGAATGDKFGKMIANKALSSTGMKNNNAARMNRFRNS